MVLLLEELVDVPYSSTVIPTIDIPVQRSAVLITERDLRYIVSNLLSGPDPAKLIGHNPTII